MWALPNIPLRYHWLIPILYLAAFLFICALAVSIVVANEGSLGFGPLMITWTAKGDKPVSPDTPAGQLAKIRYVKILYLSRETSRAAPIYSKLIPSVVRQADCTLCRAARPRLTFSRMSEAVAVQMKGVGCSLCWAM